MSELEEKSSRAMVTRILHGELVNIVDGSLEFFHDRLLERGVKYSWVFFFSKFTFVEMKAIFQKS
jgi:hypothetical protein